MVLEANYKMAVLTGNDQKILIHRNVSWLNYIYHLFIIIWNLSIYL